MITTIFLDIGGILLSNGWDHLSWEKAAKKFNLNYEEMEVLHNFIFNVFEMGSITLVDYLDTVVFNHPRDFSKEELKNFMFCESVELPDMLRGLKDGKNIATSVFIPSTTREWNSTITALRHFVKEFFIPNG